VLGDSLARPFTSGLKANERRSIGRRQSNNRGCSLSVSWAWGDQSIGASPWAVRKAFVWENGLDPKNPRRADSGEGCADSRTKILAVLNCGASALAWAPQRSTTSGVPRCARACTAAAVMFSHPILRWDPG